MNRLTFIKNTIIGSVGLVIAPSLLVEAKTKEVPMWKWFGEQRCLRMKSKKILNLKKWIETEVSAVVSGNWKDLCYLRFSIRWDSEIQDYLRISGNFDVKVLWQIIDGNPILWESKSYRPDNFYGDFYLHFVSEQAKIDFINIMYPDLNMTYCGGGCVGIEKGRKDFYFTDSMENAFKRFARERISYE